MDQLFSKMLEMAPNWVQGGSGALIVWAILHYLAKRSDERTKSSEIAAQLEQQRGVQEATNFDVATRVQAGIIDTLQKQCDACHRDLAEVRQSLQEERDAHNKTKATLIFERGEWEFKRRQMQQKIDGFTAMEGGEFTPDNLRKVADDLEARNSRHSAAVDSVRPSREKM